MIPNYKTKPIERVVDKEPIITSAQIELGKWMKDFMYPHSVSHFIK